MSLPHLILISGPPGVGKSTLARTVATRLRATHLDKDCIDEPFSPDDRGPRYTRQVEPKVLQALLSLAELNLRPGHAVLLDVPWTHIQLNSPEWTRAIRSLTKRTRSRLSVIECHLDESVHRERIRTRGLRRDDPKLTPKGWERFRRTDRLADRNPLPHFSLNMAQSREKCATAALRYLRSQKRA